MYSSGDYIPNPENDQFVDEVLSGYGFAAQLLWEPADWAITAYQCTHGDCSPLVLLGLLPLIPGGVGKHIDDIVDTGTGFANHRQLKRYLGKAGDGMDWHHIVEQIQIKKSGFLAKQIHNVDNVLAVDKTVHRQISGYYSSIRPFTNGLRVRDWLAGQSFESQFAFGMQVLRDFGVIK